ncbi:MAG: thrombospondin type 3 repeat-containing protein [Pseudomonadales bacterium]|nr:thrombospondin type 3 repeat-containing protein [Pseudomonadales bacterium]
MKINELAKAIIILCGGLFGQNAFADLWGSGTATLFGDSFVTGGEIIENFEICYSDGGGCDDQIVVTASGGCTGSGSDRQDGSGFRCFGTSPCAKFDLKMTLGSTQACKISIVGWHSNALAGTSNIPSKSAKVEHAIDWSVYPTGFVALGKGVSLLEAVAKTLEGTLDGSKGTGTLGDISDQVVSASTQNGLLKFKLTNPSDTVCKVTEAGWVTGLTEGLCDVTVSVSADDTANLIPLSIRKSWEFRWEDTDGDGMPDGSDNPLDVIDNCPDIANGPNVYADTDLVPLPLWHSESQKDTDNNGRGDACNSAQDRDGDEYEYENDNCPEDYNPLQINTDSFGRGDACNDAWDKDSDEWEDEVDNCPSTANVDQAHTGLIGDDGKIIGTACNVDTDLDGIKDPFDNCPADPNPGQEDVGDGVFGANDGIGDICAKDTDGDTIDDELDNCKFIANRNQLSTNPEAPAVGDVCSKDSDGDGIKDDTAAEKDNCPFIANTDQMDSDSNGIGDVCEMVFVVKGGAGEVIDRDCLTWEHACSTIAKGLAAAETHDKRQVFIAAEVYRPQNTLELKAGIVLVGGFNGTEQHAGQADHKLNITVISGDKDANDLADTDADGVVRSIDGVNNTENLAVILSATAQGLGQDKLIRLQGLVINAAKGSGLVVDNSQVLVTNSQFIANADSAIKATAGANLKLAKVNLEANATASALNNGAALNVSGAGTAVNIENTTFFNNVSKGIAGAIFQTDTSSLDVKSSSFSFNTALYTGGAIHLKNDVTVTIADSTFKSNEADDGGAINVKNASILMLNAIEFSSNKARINGGAISMKGTGGLIEVSQSLFFGNTAEGSAAGEGLGGALYANASGDLNVINSTFYANTSNKSGAVASLDVVDSTFDYLTLVSNTSGEGSGGISKLAGGSLSLSRSLIVGNSNNAGPSNLGGAFTDNGYNIVGFNGVSGLIDGAAISATSFTAAATPVVDGPPVAVTLKEIVNTSPNFKGGDGYYGKMKTMPLSAGSIASDVIPGDRCFNDYAGGPDVIAADNQVDMRGEKRADFLSGRCDVGAYEYTVLTCAEDAQRRYEQGEVFIKSCDERFEDFEFGSINQFMLSFLALFGLLSLMRVPRSK